MRNRRRELDYERLCRVYQRTFAAPPPEHLFDTAETGVRAMTFAIFTGTALTEDDTARGDE
ncbi:hypothetical protein CCR85_12440 [Rhodothalassium salexigens]|uniref:hypothetical protein n=1 Tax=Rhodothalassium salexigens TaxID=1086 RepID=UPI00191439B5|nr:hypothetical protein [Rhodothalassium salexigens]MBK5912299.1 hypothetical protein [Rhodothalassium salexigens]